MLAVDTVQFDEQVVVGRQVRYPDGNLLLGSEAVRQNNVQI